MVQYQWPNCSKTIKTEIQSFYTELEEILTPGLLGVYLHGSLAQGGFNPLRSDINMLVVTSQPIELEVKRKVIEVLLRLSKAPSPLEVNFLLAQDMRCEFAYNEALRGAYLENMARSAFQHPQEGIQSDYKLAISLKMVSTNGIVLEGKPVSEIVPQVPEEAFLRAIRQSFQQQYEDRLTSLVSFVLNACRTLAYLQEGLLLSKDEGGSWGLYNLPDYAGLIQQSLSLYRDERLGRPVGRAVVDDFSKFMTASILH